MISTTTIRAELEDYIKNNGTTLQRFAESSGVNVGTLSGIINGNRLIAISQLDRVTKAMGLPEGHFYNLYAEECSTPNAPHWRRIRPFLLRCAELQQHDCIKQVLCRLLEDLKQVASIFETAEMMYEQGWKEAAVILYESVIESERFSHSERLAMSYYRIFQIYQADKQRCFESALQFLPYRYRLPEALALDGLLMLVYVYSVRFRWVEAENYADELARLALALYERQAWKEEDFSSERPLVHYYGKAYLFKAGTYEYRGMYQESRKWIAQYADLSWFEGLDEEGEAEVRLLKMFAEANYMSVDIKSGNRTRIAEYVAFLENHPDEIVEGLITLVESANRHDFFVDDILVKFNDNIEQYRNFGQEDMLIQDRIDEHKPKEPPYVFRYAVFFQNYAIYNFRKGFYEEGLTNILHSMYAATKLRHKDLHANVPMAIFEIYRRFANEEQTQQYNKLCREVWDNEKENILGGFGYVDV